MLNFIWLPLLIVKAALSWRHATRQEDSAIDTTRAQRCRYSWSFCTFQKHCLDDVEGFMSTLSFRAFLHMTSKTKMRPAGTIGAINKHGGTIYKKGEAIYKNRERENSRNCQGKMQGLSFPWKKHAYCAPLFLGLSAWRPNNNLKENAKSWRRHPSKISTALWSYNAISSSPSTSRTMSNPA